MPHIIPFTQKPLSPKVGLNPLGMQNACITAYSKLLPGLNNVTNRIRYYSVYSWLLNQFFKLKPEATEEDQIHYIRKCEYLLALISVYNDDHGGVPGTMYANAVLGEQEGDDWTIDLKAGSDFNRKERRKDGRLTYWKQKGGAFRQYYAGVLTEIGLIMLPTEKKGYIYNCTRSEEHISGKKLAAAISEEMPVDKQKLFMDCVQKSSVTEGELRTLGESFNLNVFTSKYEKEALLKLLLDFDYPLQRDNKSLQRNHTLHHFLSYMKSRTVDGRIREDEFTSYMYDLFRNKNQELSEVVVGWAYYHINEMWQYNSLRIFRVILDYLEIEIGNEWIDIDHLVTYFTLKICDGFSEHLDINSQIKLSDIKSVSLTVECLLPKKSEAYFFYQILAVYFDNTDEVHAEELRKYSYALVANEKHDFRAIMDTFDHSIDLSLKEVVYNYLYAEIVYRHYNVAFAKLAQTNIATHKLSIQDYKVRGISTYDPSHTSPRLGNLVLFLSDLGILEDNALTEEGVSLLKQMDHEGI